MPDPQKSSENQSNDSLSSQSRQARVNEFNGTKIGICIFLSYNDLTELNVDPHSGRKLEYRIIDQAGQRFLSVLEADSNPSSSETNAITD